MLQRHAIQSFYASVDFRDKSLVLLLLLFRSLYTRILLRAGILTEATLQVCPRGPMKQLVLMLRHALQSLKNLDFQW